MTAIEFENVGKQYRLGLVSTQTLSHDLNRWWQMNIRHKDDPYLRIGEANDRSIKGSSDYVWALKDINFKVEQGDVVGIIGRNGAGKSTLLKLLSKVTGPTTGTIRARGRIGSLLEVGTGFHQEMTGRENIFMNGAILGMSKSEIKRKLDEIVDFSGCERYLDTPVKRYSSGMMVRLGFAVAAHLDPEILVVDEVLAVGDAEFQKKAIGKMKDVSQGEGRTVLFVSHNMDSMLNLCNNGLLLENGSVKHVGDIKTIVASYLIEDSSCIYKGTRKNSPAYIEDVHFLGSKKNASGVFSFEESVALSVKVRKTDFGAFDSKAVLSIFIKNIRQISICNVELPLEDLVENDSITFSVKYPGGILLSGRYSIAMCIHVPNVCFYDNSSICSFSITDSESEFAKYGQKDNGLIFLRPQISIMP